MKGNYKSRIINKSMKRIVAVSCVFAMILTIPLVLAVTEVNKTTSSSGETSFEAYWNKNKTGGTFSFETGAQQIPATKVLEVGSLCGSHGLKSDVIKSANNAILAQADLSVRLYSNETLKYTIEYKHGGIDNETYSLPGGHKIIDSLVNLISTEGIDDYEKFTKKYSNLVLITDGICIAEGSTGLSDKYYKLAQLMKQLYEDKRVSILTCDAPTHYGEYFGYDHHDIFKVTSYLFINSLSVFAPDYYISLCDSTTKIPNTSLISALSDYTSFFKTYTNNAPKITYDNASSVASELDGKLGYLYNKTKVTLELNDGVSVSDSSLTFQYKTDSGDWTDFGTGADKTVSGSTVTFTFNEPAGIMIRKVRAIGYWSNDGTFTEGDFLKSASFELLNDATNIKTETLSSPVLSKDSTYTPPSVDPSDPSTFPSGTDPVATVPVYPGVSSPETGDHNNMLIYAIAFVLAASFAGIVLSASENKENQ